MIDLVKNLSITSRRVKGSVIRELLKLTEKPGMISFAGGLPSPESFPVKDIADIAQKVLKENSATALQYSSTEGRIELREEIVKFMAKDGFDIEPDNVLVTASSQQGLDLVGRAFIDPTDPILVELPTYVGGLQSFSAYGARFIGVRSDEHGMIPGDLHKKLQYLHDTEEHYKFAYVVPDFQNPSGITWTLDRRRELVKMANKYNCLIVDDSPYRELRFEGSAPPTFSALDKEDNVITLRTFSKIFAPGFRLGWVVAHKSIIAKLSLVKQSVDLCTSAYSQLIAAEYLKRGLMTAHIEHTVKIYRAKRDAMLRALKAHMPKDAGVSWIKPDGGLFLWLKLPEHVSADEMFPEAIKQKVAYVIGSAFHCDGTGQNTMRLNFSYSSLEEIEEGIQRLARTIESRLRVRV
ncbi:MAG: aminotransferase [Elusimicrobia bacterium GWA2_69_24]|nr:MAG: aminotransferase [Elusimicrobia bacterium GWA2_69_24]HBL18601.1 aminotransferase [Elusimicrobiota bacterium]